MAASTTLISPPCRRRSSLRGAGALTRALATEGVTELAIPVGHLVLYALAAGLAGVPAGMPPARTAARLDVLEAIATE